MPCVLHFGRNKGKCLEVTKQHLSHRCYNILFDTYAVCNSLRLSDSVTALLKGIPGNMTQNGVTSCLESLHGTWLLTILVFMTVQGSRSRHYTGVLHTGSRRGKEERREGKGAEAKRACGGKKEGSDEKGTIRIREGSLIVKERKKG